MNKELLADYIDACKLVEETKQDIARLERKKKDIAHDNVSGSNPNYPFQPQHFHVGGITYSSDDAAMLSIERKLLSERKANAEAVKLQVEEFMNSVPARIQRIIRFKYFEGLSWEETAAQMGRNATGENLRKELKNYLKK